MLKNKLKNIKSGKRIAYHQFMTRHYTYQEVILLLDNLVAKYQC